MYIKIGDGLLSSCVDGMVKITRYRSDARYLSPADAGLTVMKLRWLGIPMEILHEYELEKYGL